MKRRVFAFIFSVLCCLVMVAQNKSQNIEIGTWRDHLCYYITHSVDKVGDRVLVGCGSSLFYYDVKTQKTEKLSKVNGLSDAGLGAVAYDKNSNSIVVTYENSNIDIVQGSNIYNIPDIKNRFIEGSKEIISISFKDDKAYLACGFGVVVLDLKRHEIYDTWYLGQNSSSIRVNAVYVNDTAIFAGTIDGLLYADRNSNTLAASETWKHKDIGAANSESFVNREIINLQGFGDGILIQAARNDNSNSILLRYNGSDMDTLYEGYVAKTRCFNDTLCVLGFRTADLYDTNYNQLYHLSETYNPIPGVNGDFKDLLVDGDDIWIAHHFQGLVHLPNYKENRLYKREMVFPMGPMTDNVYSMTFKQNGILYVAPGGKDMTSANLCIDGAIYIYDGNWWHPVETKTFKENYEGRLLDVLNVTVDPRDDCHLMASSWWNGIWEIRNDTLVQIYDSSNTNNRITPFVDSYRIIGVQYDASGNLLVGNSLSSNAFAFLNYRNEWGTFNTTAFLSGTQDELVGMTEDRIHHYKILYTKSNKILIMDNNEQMRFINPNNGSLLVTDRVNCMTQDLDGEMWIGTEKGIKVIYSLNDAFSSAGQTSELQCNNIIYNEEGIAQYLLSFENIQCIMVDGANRKWIGTERNGIYVLSANGDKEIAHFTAENSPLLSGKIICMAQNPVTGEVFIGTDRGMMSYRAESLPSNEDIEEILVYPNPVREDYDGMIAISGLVKDTDVRITDAQGRMVAHLKSLGGQAVWDGTNFNGQKVGTGIYYIFTSAQEGARKAAGKIAIIR